MLQRSVRAHKKKRLLSLSSSLALDKIQWKCNLKTKKIATVTSRPNKETKILGLEKLTKKRKQSFSNTQIKKGRSILRLQK